ncbi:allantoicase [Flavobacteriales bacterium]|nr:allantoicase [Flavobacteriales bacterium]
MTSDTKNLPAFTQFIDLAAEKLGGKTIACSDDFFAGMENLIKPGRGIFIEDKYTENGKWMDGWESRRKRTSGHDWCIIKLGATGVIKGFDVDTNHFLGNHPPFCSIEACNTPDDDLEQTTWHEVLPKFSLEPGSQHFFEVNNEKQWTHVKLHIYPDGGVARLRVYGEVKKDWSKVAIGELIDLAYAVNGAKSILCNDMFFSHMDNLLMPGRGVNMGDGWETKRNRTPNNRDWVIIRLAHKGKIRKIGVDTCHFKGNYPDSCLIEGCHTHDDQIENANWIEILPQSKLQADHEHYFEENLNSENEFTHVRLSIFPDGGISRLRLWGTITS